MEPSITEAHLGLQTANDVVIARQTVRRLCQDIGFSLVDQTKMVTATSELARNTVVYGRGGVMHWQMLQNAGRTGLQLRFVDHGPGIENVDLAMTDGWTSGQGLGKGLPGSKRLVDEFHLETVVGSGTTVTITRWR